jgi:hypothetical protein
MLENANTNKGKVNKMSATLDIKRGTQVRLNIASGRPFKTMDGNLHEGGQVYRVLGTYGTLLRLSRVGDNAKLITQPEVCSVI